MPNHEADIVNANKGTSRTNIAYDKNGIYPSKFVVIGLCQVCAGLNI
jgi:hypothetical protein